MAGPERVAEVVAAERQHYVARGGEQRQIEPLEEGEAYGLYLCLVPGDAATTHVH
jgi:hypothetical protein